MMKRAAMVLILITVLFLLGCQKPSGEYYILKQVETPETTEEPETPAEEGEIEKMGTEGSMEETGLSCTHNENCSWEELCIEGKCRILDELYRSTEGCEKECKVTGVEILTSDGETYSLSPRQGSYTAAGALDWTIVSGSDYCQGEEIVIPVNILKRNYGQIFSDEVIVLKVGETSSVIKHPFIKRVAFTLKVVNVDEVCS